MAESPFPGMDPYLEAPGLWPGFHARLMPMMAKLLMPLLVPKYIADLETEIVIDRVGDDYDDEESRSARPDVAIWQTREPSPALSGAATAATAATSAPLRLAVPMSAPLRLITIHIRQRQTDRLVTVIELLSPVNKRPGDGRHSYLEKRMDYFESDVHLVEIDLLRKWARMPLEGKRPKSAYLAMVSSAYERPQCDVWPISLRQPLPALPVPLLRPDPPVHLDLQRAVRTVYDEGRYDLRIDYTQPSEPPLADADLNWTLTLLQDPGRTTELKDI